MLYRINFLLLLLCVAVTAAAMPFNDDMVDNSIRSGSFARARVHGTVPRGASYLAPYANKEAVPEDLKNPVVITQRSLLRGERLFSANCTACHGLIDQEPYTPVRSGTLMGAPNIADSFYSTRTDASLYSTIRFGNVIMPPLGWKLSDVEVWDIINFLRKVQSKKASENSNAAAQEK